MKRKIGALATLFVCLFALFPALAQGEEARDITQLCTLSAPENKTLKCLSDGKYTTRWASQGGGRARLSIALPEGETCGGVYLQFYEEGVPFDVQAQNEAGQWETVASCETSYLTGYVQVPEGLDHLRIVPGEGARRLKLAQVHVFSPGEAPDWVQRWQPPCEKADLLMLVAHPDDEVLFMGGTLPTYAGERAMQVQVCHLVPATPYRKLELLDCLWLSGVRNYPDLGDFRDIYKISLREMYKQTTWSEKRVLRHVTGLLRKYRPEVVVTHDINGEYGHGAHKVCADALQKCVALAADPTYESDQVAAWGTWQIKKLYLHLYPENVVDMDWRVPLSAFGGKTAFDIAEAGFACHISQQKTKYAVEDWGPYDNSLFGLAFSTVGEDTEKNDFFENIAL